MVFSLVPRKLGRPVVAPAEHEQPEPAVARHEHGAVATTRLKGADDGLGGYVGESCEVKKHHVREVTLEEELIVAGHALFASVTSSDDDERGADERGGVTTSGGGQWAAQGWGRPAEITEMEQIEFIRAALIPRRLYGRVEIVWFVNGRAEIVEIVWFVNLWFVNLWPHPEASPHRHGRIERRAGERGRVTKPWIGRRACRSEAPPRRVEHGAAHIEAQQRIVDQRAFDAGGAGRVWRRGILAPDCGEPAEDDERLGPAGDGHAPVGFVGFVFVFVGFVFGFVFMPIVSTSAVVSVRTSAVSGIVSSAVRRAVVSGTAVPGARPSRSTVPGVHPSMSAVPGVHPSWSAVPGVTRRLARPAGHVHARVRHARPAMRRWRRRMPALGSCVEGVRIRAVDAFTGRCEKATTDNVHARAHACPLLPCAAGEGWGWTP
jgi:hypothetical protein